MKFGKEFTSQMVPEWQEAYMNYNYLKTHLKEIQTFRQKNHPAHPTGLKRKPTLYRAFSGLIHRQHSGRNAVSPAGDGGDIESQAILITGGGGSKGAGGYQTTFLMTAEEGGEYELVFFRRLDEEFNKVDRFYKGKVDEVMKEAELLNKQMEALIAFRIKVDNPTGWFDRSVEMTRLATDIAASTATISASVPHGVRANSKRVAFMDVIEEGGSSTVRGERSEDGNEDEDQKSPIEVNDDNNGATTVVNVNEQRSIVEKEKEIKKANYRGIRPAPLEVLNYVTMNKTVETPRSTIKEFLKVPKQTELTFNRQNLRKVESQLKQAFIEFYQKLRLLKSFGFLNTLAFSKIMKKYDKITTRDASKSYMTMVDNSYLGSSDEVNKLMERVEATFIKHFANANRSKGMSVLRPKPKRERHRVSFSTGFFVGCSFALILALILIVRARKLMNDPGKAQYMNTMFPLYSLFGFIVLHMIMYAVNVFYWRRYRVNYSFIFGFKQGTELDYRQVLLPSFIIATLALGAVLSNLDMQLDPKTKDYKALTELLPLLLLVSLVVVLLCPFNIIYRSSRYFFLTCFVHGLLAPLYKVTLPDFFLSDQFTSQVQALRSFNFYICYYGWGDYKKRETTCQDESVYKIFLFLIAVVPYMSRLLQCLRRLFEEKDPMQGYNGIKYFITIVAVCVRTAYTIDKGMSWKVTAWMFSISAAVVCTYWDLVIDWGLLQRNSKNRWLRDKLLVPHKSVYFVAMGANVLLRITWLQTVLNYYPSFLHRQTMIAIVASLEIIRRGIWNFFRLENEHLNNVGKYRAFKSVPLPFNYEEDDDKDE